MGFISFLWGANDFYLSWSVVKPVPLFDVLLGTDTFHVAWAFGEFGRFELLSGNGMWCSSWCTHNGIDHRSKFPTQPCFPSRSGLAKLSPDPETEAKAQGGLVWVVFFGACKPATDRTGYINDQWWSYIKIIKDHKRSEKINEAGLLRFSFVVSTPKGSHHIHMYQRFLIRMRQCWKLAKGN